MLTPDTPHIKISCGFHARRNLNPWEQKNKKESDLILLTFESLLQRKSKADVFNLVVEAFPFLLDFGHLLYHLCYK